jgi:hypothetical protein
MTFKEGDTIDVIGGVNKQRRGTFVRYCGKLSCVVLLAGDADAKTVRLASIKRTEDEDGNESESERFHDPIGSNDNVLISRQEYQSLLRDVQRLTEALQKFDIKKGKKS